MRTDVLPKNQSVFQAKRANGLLFGIVSGLAVTAALWGLDGLALYRAHVFLFWLKLAAGGGVALALCSLVGWLAIWLDRPAVGAFLWALAGWGLAWLVVYLPYQGYSWVIEIMQISFPVEISLATAGVGARLALVSGILVVTLAIVGTLEFHLVDNATQAAAPFSRWFSLCVCIPILLVGGGFADNLVNQGLREPLIALDSVIQFAIESQGKQVDSKLARERHLRAVDAVQELLSRPRKLILASCDDEVVMVNVLIDFKGTWATCSVINNQPGYCKLLNEEEPGGTIPASQLSAPQTKEIVVPGGTAVASVSGATPVVRTTALVPLPTLTAVSTPSPSPTEQPVPTPILSVRFAVIGDYGLAGQAEEAVATLVKQWGPDLIITTGDNCFFVKKI